jgi:hypothetical protein
MNTQQAKFILQGYRPNGADAGDATFAEALEQAKLDPILGQWLAREQSLDRAISAKLAEVPAPAGLRESILAGGRVSNTTRRSWWQHPALMAAAAGFAVLLATGLALWPKQVAANSPLAEFALGDTLADSHGGGHGEETSALQAMLSQPTTRLGNRLPVDFKSLCTAGCRTVNFEGHDVLEVCFKREGAWFHCYIAQRADFPALAAAAAPVLSDRTGASIASWADSSLLYVVVSKTGHTALARLL